MFESQFSPAMRAVMRAAFQQHYVGHRGGAHRYTTERGPKGKELTTAQFTEGFVKANPQFRKIKTATLESQFSALAREAGSVARHKQEGKRGTDLQRAVAKELRRRLRTMPIHKLAKLLNGKGV
jgi:hypothetical protein